MAVSGPADCRSVNGFTEDDSERDQCGQNTARLPTQCGTITGMRLPDRPWAETDGTPDERPDDLADRLARLPAGHPSGDYADYADPDHAEPDELSPDDLEPDVVGPGDEGDRVPPHGFHPGRSGAAAAWDGHAGHERSPYRPWFSVDGVGDPWFALPIE